MQARDAALIVSMHVQSGTLILLKQLRTISLSSAVESSTNTRKTIFSVHAYKSLRELTTKNVNLEQLSAGKPINISNLTFT